MLIQTCRNLEMDRRVDSSGAVWLGPKDDRDHERQREERGDTHENGHGPAAVGVREVRVVAGSSPQDHLSCVFLKDDFVSFSINLVGIWSWFLRLLSASFRN